MAIEDMRFPLASVNRILTREMSPVKWTVAVAKRPNARYSRAEAGCSFTRNQNESSVRSISTSVSKLTGLTK